MDDYVMVVDTRQIAPNSITIVSGIDIVDICLVNIDGKYYAVSSVCTHIGGPLGKGAVKGGHLVCPWHGAHFNLENGKAFFPAKRSLRRFDVKVEGTSVYIRGSKQAELSK